MTIDLKPTPDEVARGRDLVLDHVPDMDHSTAIAIAHALMRHDPREPRITAHITTLQLAVAELEGEVRTWLCPGCNTAYPEPPGPKDNVFTRFECPKCRDTVWLHNAVLLRRERTERQAERLAHRTELEALQSLLEGAREMIDNFNEASDG